MLAWLAAGSAHGQQDAHGEVSVLIGGETPRCDSQGATDLAVAEAAKLLAPPELAVRPLDESTLAAWSDKTREALEQLADAKQRRALGTLEAAERLLDGVAFGTNATLRTQRLDACLLEVRALQELGDDSGATERTLACRNRVPRGWPTLRKHPPETLAALNETDAAIGRGRGAKITMNLEASCHLLLNDTRMPAEHELLVAPGMYTGQVVCGDRTTPTFAVTATASTPGRIVTSPSFYDAVRQTPCTHLHFDTEESFLQHNAALSSALKSLGLPSTLKSSALVEATRNGAAPGTANVKKSRRVAGWSLIGAGTAASVGAVALLFVRGSRGDDLKSMIEAGSFSSGAADDWLNIRAPLLTLASVGPALTLTGTALVMKPRERVPWWSWTLGAIGLGATAFGVAELVRGGRCDALSSACISDEAKRDRGAFLIAHGLMLVGVPVIHLLKKDHAVSLEAAGTTLKLRVALR